MTAVSENGQVYFTFEELDLHEEYKAVLEESNVCLKRCDSITKLIGNYMKEDMQFARTLTFRRLYEKRATAFKRHRNLLEVSKLIYSLWMKE